MKCTEKRKHEKSAKDSKTVKDYDWVALYQGNFLQKLTLQELDLYIKDKKLALPESARKHDKVTIIAGDIAKRLAYNLHQQTQHAASDENATASSSDEFDEQEINSASSSSEESAEEVLVQPQQLSRYGRRQGNWKIRQFFGD